MRVGIIGTRGVPNRYGGFERFAELLVQDSTWETRGIEWLVYGEVACERYNRWTSVKDVGARKSANPIYYYSVSLLRAVKVCDVVICCGVGVSYLALLPRLCGVPLLVNPDGCEWRRTKWSRLGRLAIRAMYAPALICATRVILDSKGLSEDFGCIVKLKSVYIGYQAPEPTRHELGVKTRGMYRISVPYVLLIARLEPENNIETVVKAFAGACPTGLELFIVGGTSTKYFRDRLATYESEAIRFLGSIYNQSELNELRGGCCAYVHGHSVGGTNPSLLEALATVGGRILCHDNKYNREVAGGEAEYFAGVDDLILQFCRLAVDVDQGRTKSRVPTRAAQFHPGAIAQVYADLIEEVAGRSRSKCSGASGPA